MGSETAKHTGVSPEPAQRLKKARIAAGYATETSFAKAHGIPQPTYNLHESGGRGIRSSVAQKYARLLRNCTAAWILTGEGEGPSTEASIGVADALHLADEIATNIEKRVALRDTSPVLGDTIKDLDELALLRFFRPLNRTAKATVFGRLQIGELPSLAEPKSGRR